jgi:hypothetical protein
MGEIRKPDANPIIFALANWFGGCVGYFIMGQQGKAIAALIYTVVLSGCTMGVGWFIVFVFMYDAYLLGQKLQNGEAIGEKENGLDFLSNLPGFK